ncbi:pentapeptide repeat-containing protein [Flavobacterium sp. FBOR7N2.3]|uniref:Pentapeptide repeat-containing protein n=1 Tax=Flavobacterium magnesitis TaxID=3138077 RepID=A0ABV4TL92_9FLAO
MTEYFFDQHYHNIRYGLETLNLKEFESCTFNNCDFSECNLIGVTFMDCQFNNCNFNTSKINHTAFRTVFFNDCQIKEVNFSMSDKLIFEIHFKNCALDFSKFYALKMKGTTFTNSSLVAVDFMATDLTGVQFINCDLYRSEFEKAIANKVDFRSSYNYTIDPSKTKLKKAQFALEGLKGLLYKHGIIVE